MRSNIDPGTKTEDRPLEFVSKALSSWAVKDSLGMALIDPGKPWQDGTADSFNGKFQDECLSMEWFRCRAEAKAVIGGWRSHYNSVRPHSSLANMTSDAFRMASGENHNLGAVLNYEWSEETW